MALEGNPVPQYIEMPGNELAAVVFGCTKKTMDECIDSNLFGLPFNHMKYVQNIKPGMLLFLFNYTDRLLHGIFRATSPGSLNINPHAWTEAGRGQSRFPAQVSVERLDYCRPLSEPQYKPLLQGTVVAGGSTKHIYRFSLDAPSVEKLCASFRAQRIPGTQPLPSRPASANAPLAGAAPVAATVRQSTGPSAAPIVGHGGPTQPSSASLPRGNGGGQGFMSASCTTLTRPASSSPDLVSAPSSQRAMTGVESRAGAMAACPSGNSNGAVEHGPAGERSAGGRMPPNANAATQAAPMASSSAASHATSPTTDATGAAIASRAEGGATHSASSAAAAKAVPFDKSSSASSDRGHGAASSGGAPRPGHAGGVPSVGGGAGDAASISPAETSFEAELAKGLASIRCAMQAQIAAAMQQLRPVIWQQLMEELEPGLEAARRETEQLRARVEAAERALAAYKQRQQTELHTLVQEPALQQQEQQREPSQQQQRQPRPASPAGGVDVGTRMSHPGAGPRVMTPLPSSVQTTHAVASGQPPFPAAAALTSVSGNSAGLPHGPASSTAPSVGGTSTGVTRAPTTYKAPIPGVAPAFPDNNHQKNVAADAAVSMESLSISDDDLLSHIQCD